MIFEFSASAAKDLAYWKRHDASKVARLKQLLKDIAQSPFSGVGKPEPLKHQLSGYWSRRISAEHRLVYKVSGDTCLVLSCRFHYDNI
jgi:toxin YoeB